MKQLIRYKYHLAAILVLITFLLAAKKTNLTQVTEGPQDLPRIETTGQLEHALELFTAEYSADLLSVDSGSDQRAFILAQVTKSLPKAHKAQAFEVARTLIVEANHHGMDPLFLMAVIQTESSFNPKARGGHGEIGLMQILPKTAEWLAGQAGLTVAQVDLADPKINIRIGATYFAQLRKTFAKRGTRYVAAYNMGVRNVRKLVAKNVEPKIYSSKVIGYYKGYYEKMAPAASTVRQVASAQ